MHDAAIAKINARVIEKGPGKEKFDAEELAVNIADIENVDDVVRTVLARAKLALEYREPFEEQWRRAFKAWMQVLETVKEDSWESKRFLPMILQHVESALPSIVAAALGGERIWACNGMTPQGRDSAKALEKLLTWQARGPSGIDEAIEDMLWWSIVVGTGFTDVRWSTLYGDRLVATVEDEVNEAGNPMMGDDGKPQKVKVVTKKNVKIEDWPVGESLNPLDVYMCPWSRPGMDADWCVLRRETTLGRLKAAAGKGHIDKDAVEEWNVAEKPTEGNPFDLSFFEAVNTATYDQWVQDAGLGGRHSLDMTDDHHEFDKPIVLLVYRSKHEMITVAPSGRILGYSKNEMMHQKTGIVSHSFIPIPGCPYGRGLGTILLGHQELVNENINLFMDVAKISLMSPVIVSRGQISILDKNFRWQPNALIWARDVNNAAKRMEVPAPSNLAMLLDQHFRRDADDTTGFNEQARGSSPGVNTATEFTGLQTNIKTRAFMHVRRLNRTLKRIGQLLVALNQQFMTKEQIISVVGDDGLDYLTVKPWEIVGEVVVQATVSSSRIAPAMRAQQLIAVTQVIAPLMAQAQQNPFFLKWIRMILETIEVEDLDRMIPKHSKVHSAIAENIMLDRGAKTPVSAMDPHDLHIATHTEGMLAKQNEGADPAIIQAYKEHLQEHVIMAQQSLMMEQGGGGGGGPAPGNLGAVAPERAGAQGMGAAQGSDGVPGAASPGPAAPVGRAA